jgi:hypothetical protein
MFLGVWGEAMSEHTKGRIRIIELAGANPSWLAAVDEQDDGGDLICCAPDGEVSMERWPANARRLVACWNACDGISTEALEKAGDAVKASMPLVELERQRDEAVRLLREECSDHCEPNGDPCLCPKCAFLAHLEGK